MVTIQNPSTFWTVHFRGTVHFYKNDRPLSGTSTFDITQKIIKVYAIPDYDFVAAVQNVDKDIASGKLKSAPKFDDTRRLQDLTTGKRFNPYT